VHAIAQKALQLFSGLARKALILKAHWACLEASAFVSIPLQYLGTGLNVGITPRTRVCSNFAAGLKVEHPLGTQPESGYFPSAWRIVATASNSNHGSFRTESGALITAICLASYNPGSFLPGSLDNPRQWAAWGDSR